MAPLPPVDPLARALQRLDDRIRRWSPARWQAPVRSRPGQEELVLRAQLAYELAATLAELAREAGNGAPDRPPPQLPAYALADQLTVLGREVLDAPEAARVQDRARAAVEQVYEALS